MEGKARKQTVVVTGVSSFIGFHLARNLAEDPFHVIGTISQDIHHYDALRTERLKRLIEAKIEIKQLDIRNAAGLRDFIQAIRPDVWIHHAGWAKDYSSLGYSLDQGHLVNVAPLYTLYSSLSDCGCKGVIVTGSSAEYGTSDRGCREEDACWPNTPYGLSKLSETVRAYQLAHEFQLPTRIARVFIPYGVLDAPGKLVPSVIEALKEGNPIELSGCEQSRDFIHIGDLTKGYKALMEDLNRKALFDVFNLCHGKPTQLRSLLLNIARILGADENLLVFGKRPLRPGEDMVNYGSNQKAITMLDWKPSSLEEGLQAYLMEDLSNKK
ncbi:NAD(P)-dependent oxidoreductase [Bacillus sp. REN3]|uniref:NAD-dependent epimerase/dehydratase family protein n=1 Tax=Bacillus sp. REN3 TaxID=2802440 RepID=UPI001AEE5212|nr:NAD(P)-dependent oxidoreductase [Bacillus sp. REN3]